MRIRPGVGLSLALAVLLAAPGVGSPAGHGPLAPAPAASSPPSTVATGPSVAPAPPAAAARLSVAGAMLPIATPRNVLVDVPCNTSSNAEVEQAFDPALGYLYETWIGCGGIGFSRSTDGGFSFDPAFAVPGSLSGSWDPAIAVSANGTVYVSFMSSSPGDTPVVAWSWDHGATFAGWADVFAPPANSFSDRDFLAIAPNGTLYVTWDFSPEANWPNGTALDQIGCAAGGSCYFVAGDYNIVIAWSTNGGRNWSGYVPVDPEYPWGGAPCGPLLVTPNGTLDVLFEDYNISGWDHRLGLGYNYFTRSVDGGLTWSSPLAVSNRSFLNDVWWIDGDLAQDRSGTLYATFDSVNATRDTAWVTLSQDGGATWGPALQVNPAATDGGANNLVGVAGGENGTAYIAWMANVSGGEIAYEVALGGNGTTFGPVTQVSGASGIDGLWVGDTLGISYLGSGAVAVSWTYGVLQAGIPSSQVFAAVLGESVPGAPVATSVVPGAASATVAWSPPTAPGPVRAYRVSWGVENGSATNVSVPASARSFTITGLTAYVHYQAQVDAVNGAGLGPPGPAVAFTLFAWTRVQGTVDPPGATVLVDGVPTTLAAGTFSVNTTFAPHLVTAEAADHAIQVFAVPPVWNATAWANLSLSWLPGTIEGWVSPATALVAWNGSSVPVTGGFFEFNEPAGSVGWLNTSFPGLIPSSRTLTVVANRTLWANVTLAAPNATLGFLVRPVSAVLLVDGGPIVLDAAGRAAVSLAGGTHPIEVTAASYYPYFANASLRAGEWLNLSINLTAIPASGNPNGTSNGSAHPSPLQDPIVLGLIGGVGVLAVAIILLGRRGRRPPSESDSPAEMPAAPVAQRDEGDPALR